MLKKRTFVLLIFILVISSLLALRLFYIQVFNSYYFSERAIAQKSEFFSGNIRGDIAERNNISLLGSYLDPYVIVSPGWLMESEKKMLIENGLLKNSEVEKPVVLSVTQENIAVLNSLKGKTPGLYFYRKKTRYGPAAVATHLVGYKGQTGIEKAFDDILKSRHKEIEIITDGLGQPIPGLSASKTDSIHNPYVKLTLDYKVQIAVENIMDICGKKGAVVVLDAETGEILAMASRPNYKQYKLEDYLDRKDAPLVNRAVEAFTPGSIFKVVLLAAALEEGVTDLDEVFECTGSVKLGGNIYKCSSYEDGGHGKITLKDAVARSCNSVFIELGIRLGKEKIIEYARLFGLGNPVPIGLPEEKGGSIPDAKETYFQDIGNLSIGQGKITMTPLQAAQMMLIITNDGVLKSPYLLIEAIDEEGRIQTINKQKDRKIITDATAKKVREALYAVTQYGTGTMANNTKSTIRCAGKTGTAEIIKDVYHAWFVGYFPEDKPRYIVTVFLERGGSGPTQAAPVFRDIANKLLENEKKE